MVSVMQAGAQSVTNSPYSRYGVGDISYMGSGHNIAMGGTSVGESSPLYINTVNPACNTSFGMQRFLFDVGFDLKFTTTSSAETSQKNTNSTFRYLAAGFAAKPWWFFAFQLKPYSSVGYNMETTKETEYNGDKRYFSETYKGQGGLNKVSLSTAFKIARMFSVGATGSVLFGNLERYHTLGSSRYDGLMDGSSSYSTTQISYSDKNIIHGLQYDLGFRFEKAIRSKKDTLRNAVLFSVGAYLGNKADLKSRDELLVTQYENCYTTYSNDTVYCDTLYDGRLTIPRGFGLGVSVEFMDKLKINADYQSQDWNKFSIPGQETESEMRKSQYMGLGLQFVSAKYSSHYLRTINYRIGVHKQDTYLNVGGHAIQDQGFTFGLGFPMRSLILNVSCDFGKRGTTEHNLYEEKYCLLHFNVTAHSIWFVKRKFH